MSEYIKRELLPERKGYWDDDFGAGWDACLDEIAKLPAANVKPAVQGKWRLGGYGQISDATEKWYDKYLTGGFLYCSVCKGRTSSKFNYCPHCGADMRGGGQHGV